MCGRFVRVSPYVVISEAFLLSGSASETRGSFNIAPGQDIAAVVAGPGAGGLSFSAGASCPPGAKTLKHRR